MGFETNPEHINRKGRPKKGNTISDLIEKKLDKVSFVESLIGLAKKGNFQAIKEIIERIDGKVADKQRYVDEEDKDVNINVNIKRIKK